MLISSDIFIDFTSHYHRCFWAGLFAGCALGCKVLAAPAVLVLCIASIIQAWRNGQRKHLFTSAILFLTGLALMGSWWYIRNIILTGNPLFPAEIGPFGGPFTKAMQSQTKLISRLMDPSLWPTITRNHIEWPIGVGILSITGYLISCFHLVFRRTPLLSKHQRHVVILLLAIGCILLLAYPFSPFSGSYNSPGASLKISLRYIITIFIIGIVMCMMHLSLYPFRFKIICFCVVSLAIVFYQHCWQDMVRWGGFIVLGIFVYIWELRSRFLSAFLNKDAILPLVLIGMTFGIIGIALTESVQLERTSRRLYTFRGSSDPSGRAWKALEQLPTGASLHWFGPTSYQYYPLFGRSYQYRPYRMSKDGSLYVPLHQEFKENPDGRLWWRGPNETPGDVLLANMQHNGVDYIIVSQFPDGAWPKIRQILLNTSLKCIYEEKGVEIWSINDGK